MSVPKKKRHFEAVEGRRRRKKRFFGGGSFVGCFSRALEMVARE